MPSRQPLRASGIPSPSSTCRSCVPQARLHLRFTRWLLRSGLLLSRLLDLHKSPLRPHLLSPPLLLPPPPVMEMALFPRLPLRPPSLVMEMTHFPRLPLRPPSPTPPYPLLRSLPHLLPIPSRPPVPSPSYLLLLSVTALRVVTQVQVAYHRLSAISCIDLR